jgi:type IV pilus assembly protein PilW
MVNSKKNYTVQDSLARLQENARFAVDSIVRDLRMVGYFGCADDLAAVRNNVNPTASNVFDTSIPVEGLEDMVVGTSTWYPSGTSTSDLYGATVKIVPGTDALIVRFMAGLGTPVLEPYMPQEAAALQIATSNGLKKGDIVMVADCSSADVFQITGPTDPNGTGTLNHNTGEAGVEPGNNVKALSKIYEEKSFIAKLSALRYFVATTATRPDRPGLYRQNGVEAPQELVEGIESMQVLYGEDTDGDRVPNVYVSADRVANWRNVVSIRIGLLAYTLASETESGEYGNVKDSGPHDVNGEELSVAKGNLEAKRVKRRVFNTTIALRNLR